MKGRRKYGGKKEEREKNAPFLSPVSSRFILLRCEAARGSRVSSRACTFHDIPQMESLLAGYINECSIILPWQILVSSLIVWTGFRIMISCCDPGGKGNAGLCGDSSLAFGPALRRSSLSNSSNLTICFYRLAHILRAYPRHSSCYHQLQR